MEDDKSLQEYANMAGSAKLKRLSGEIDELYQNIVGSVPVASLPEKDFKEYFLKFFKSQVTDIELSKVLYKSWLNIANGPYNIVNIVDTNGNVIFTTPPLFARPTTNETMGSVNFNNIVDNYTLRSNRLAADGDNYLAANLSGVATGIEAEQAELKLKWLAVLNRYDDELKITNDKKQPTIEDNVTDFLDYD